MYLQHMLLKISIKLFGNLHFPSIMFIVLTSFKHPKLLLKIKIPVTLQQFVYICMTAILLNLISRTTILLTCYLRSCNTNGKQGRSFCLFVLMLYVPGNTFSVMFKMVQDCVFAQSSEFQFGVRS